MVKGSLSSFELPGDLADITKHFNSGKRTATSPFANAGVLLGRGVRTLAVLPNYHGPYTVLGDLLLTTKEVPKEFLVPATKVKDWLYFKGGKKETRTNATSGFSYNYSEGAMVFPDPLDKASRTIVTGEGGASPSRFKHVVRTPGGKLRRLTPVELEHLNMFPDGHTEGASDAQRAFFMGNALVTGIVERVGKVLVERVGGKE